MLDALRLLWRMLVTSYRMVRLVLRVGVYGLGVVDGMIKTLEGVLEGLRGARLDRRKR
jgi:hypothetical protein